jgi:hypothetical protein
LQYTSGFHAEHDRGVRDEGVVRSGDEGYTLDEKVEQVMQQLRERKAKVVVDLVMETANNVISR